MAYCVDRSSSAVGQPVEPTRHSVYPECMGIVYGTVVPSRVLFLMVLSSCTDAAQVASWVIGLWPNTRVCQLLNKYVSEEAGGAGGNGHRSGVRHADHTLRLEANVFTCQWFQLPLDSTDVQLLPGRNLPPVPTAYLIFIHPFLPSIKDVEKQRWSLARLIARMPTGASGVENLLSEHPFRALPSRVGRHHILVQCSSLREKPRCTAP